MAQISAKVQDRLSAGIKRYIPILSSAKSRDVNESDTVTIITDMLADVFGFDKYSEITSEYVIRSTYVDLAIKLDGKAQVLIEVKAIGLELKDAYIKQAVDYGANLGIEWIVLTNGAVWQIYKVTFGKPIGFDLVIQIDFLNLNPKNSAGIESLYLLTKEGIGRSVLGEYHTQRQALSRFFIGAITLSEPVLDVIRRELRKISPDVKIDNEQIKDVLVQEIIKRDVMEGEKADEALRKVTKATKRTVKRVRASSSEEEVIEEEQETISNPDVDPAS
jgi:predicted type IV restriction endonuclease